jgi:predicted adenine nucleotide alpha hydrolase (AANH) superfamily ATPase
MKILLHMCCANCALYPFQQLNEEGHEVFGFFYNPNIQPYQEYVKRLEAVKEIEKEWNIRIIYQDEYSLVDFLRSVVFRENERCRICYHLRLTATAKIARRGKFDAFTSTLLGSKQQDFDLIREIGEGVGKGEGVAFLDRDFRGGWAQGREASKELGLYRQQYCGCIYSEEERFVNRNK